MTAGIVSATARTVRSGDNDQAVFAAVQTDAAINPGNSGGALVDLNGNVIGINAAIASTSSSGVTVPGQQTTQSGSIGIGFAIPSDEASRIATELITTGKATHAVLGVEVSASTTTTAGATLRTVTTRGRRGQGRTAGRRRGHPRRQLADRDRRRPDRGHPGPRGEGHRDTHLHPVGHDAHDHGDADVRDQLSATYT